MLWNASTVSTLNFSKTKRMSCRKVNGLQEADSCSKEVLDGCCGARGEVTQVTVVRTHRHKSRAECYIAVLQEGLILQLRETVVCLEQRIQMLEKQVRYFSLPVLELIFDLHVWLTACVPAVSRKMSSGWRMRGFGQQSIVYHCSRRDATITGTITLIVCPEMGEEEEADFQAMGAVLQGLACEPLEKSVDLFFLFFARIEFNKLVR